MRSVPTSNPLLPWDICQEIIDAFWWSNVSNEDRIKFMLASSLVSKAWRQLYTLISLRDIHVATPVYGLNMTHLGSLYNFQYDPSLNDKVGELCRSITFHIEDDASHACAPEELEDRGMGSCVTVTLYTLNTFPYLLPNLRRVRLEYVNYPYVDLFHNLRLYHLPPMVEALDVEYRFDDSLPGEVLAIQRKEQDLRHFAVWALGNVKELSIIGGTQAVAKELLRRTVVLEKLTIDSQVDLQRLPNGLVDMRTCHVFQV
ncbi:hypothetical protein HDZ31DRAFT_64760 [Schizophyllum fasciatum]